MIEKSNLFKLYNSGLSMKEIARNLSISEHKVVYWMNKYSITRRGRSEALYIKHNPEGDPFSLVKLDSIDKIALFSVAIGLFLGEGTKKSDHSVRFTNSDPNIIRLYMRFLREICNIRENKIKAWLNTYDDQDIETILTYWAEVTSLKEGQFYKSTIRKSKVGTYKNKSRYGTITILVENKRLLQLINTWCSYFLSNADMAQWQSTFLVKRKFCPLEK